MTNRDASQRYGVPLHQLEGEVRVALEDMVEQTDTTPVRDLDPGLPHPDREWANSGG